MFIRIDKLIIKIDTIKEVFCRKKYIYIYKEDESVRETSFDTEEKAQKEFERIEKLLIKE